MALKASITSPVRKRKIRQYLTFGPWKEEDAHHQLRRFINSSIAYKENKKAIAHDTNRGYSSYKFNATLSYFLCVFMKRPLFHLARKNVKKELFKWQNQHLSI